MGYIFLKIPHQKNSHSDNNGISSTSHQRLCSGCGVQEGREVLVRVRVLVLVVVLMELKGQGRHARLVLRRPA